MAMTTGVQEPTPKQEIVFMGRAAKAVSRMGVAGRRWLLRWLRDNYTDDWRQVENERRYGWRK
jgi:hypothetical protein